MIPGMFVSLFTMKCSSSFIGAQNIHLHKNATVEKIQNLFLISWANFLTEVNGKISYAN